MELWGALYTHILCNIGINQLKKQSVLLRYIVHFISVNDIQDNPNRWFFVQAMYTCDDCQDDPNIFRNNFAHRRGSLPRLHCTTTTQLKACKSILSSENRGRKKREKERNRRKYCSKEQNYLFSCTSLNRHKFCLGVSLNLSSCSIFLLIFCNCNILR